MVNHLGEFKRYLENNDNIRYDTFKVSLYQIVSIILKICHDIAGNLA